MNSVAVDKSTRGEGMNINLRPDYLWCQILRNAIINLFNTGSAINSSSARSLCSACKSIKFLEPRISRYFKESQQQHRNQHAQACQRQVKHHYTVTAYQSPIINEVNETKNTCAANQCTLQEYGDHWRWAEYQDKKYKLKVMQSSDSRHHIRIKKISALF